MARTKIDLDLMLAGYLTGPGGEKRFIHGLDELAHDALLYGTVLYWDDDLPSQHLTGLCYIWSGIILLSPTVWEASHSQPWFLRDIISHEIAHRVVGRSHDRVRAWQHRTHPDLIEPLEAYRWLG